MQHKSPIPNKRKAAGGQRQAANQNKQNHSIGNGITAQQQKLLQGLNQGPLTTLAARRDLDILHPAARVQELRDRGFNIITHWQTDITESGHEHRVASYVLVKRESHDAHA